MRIGKFAFLLAISANVFIPAARAAVYRVSPDAADSSSGASWSEATTLSDALSRAKSGDEVWLKSGPYTFSTTLGVGAVVSTDIKIRGGFAGTESSASERTFSDSTVLKGAVTNLLINAPSGLVEIDHITVKGAKGHGIFKEGAASLALSYVNSEENGIVEKSVNVDYSTDGRGGFFTGDAASSELTLDHCVFRGNREWRPGGFCTFNPGYKAKTTGIGLIAKDFKRVYMTDCLMVGNGLRQQDRLGGGIAAMVSPPGEDQHTQSVFYFENAPLTATRVRFIGNRTGASGTRGGRLTYIKGGNGSSFVDCVWAANDFVCAKPKTYTSPSGYNQCGSLVLDLGSQTATATISGCTFAYNVSGLGWTAGLNVEQGKVTVDKSVFFGNVISSYFGRFADLHVCYRGSCTVSDSVFRGRGGMYFDDSNTRLRIDESCRYGDPDFKTTPQEFISKYVTLGVGTDNNDNATTMSLTDESFPFVEKKASFPTGGYWNGFTFWVTNDSNVEAIDLTRGEFKPIAQSEPEAPDTSCDWARKTLGVEPVQTYYMPNTFMPYETIGCQSISGHKVFWFNHTYDPDWGGVYPEQEDRFALAKPSDGDNPGRPLLVVLHSRGGGKSGAEGTIGSLGNSDSVAYCPPEFYGLVLDCMGDVGKKDRDYTVLNDFWWGAMPPGTTANGNAGHAMGGSYWTFIYGTLMGELFDGPTKDPWKNAIHPVETCLQWLSRGEPPASKRVMDTIEWVVRKYKIDRNRIYLCGNSMGGQGSLGIGLPHGEVFAAINGNVPATIWYAAKRMGFVDNDGNDVSFEDYQVPAYDPPFLLDWSGSDDAWSRDHDVLYRNMSRFKFGMIGWWGDYGHCGGKKSAREKNDLVEQFPWLEIRKNEAYPVFTAASTDNQLPWPQVSWYDTGNVIIENGIEKVDAGLVPRLGCDTNGQVNAWFRWDVKADTPETFEIDLKIANSDEVTSTQFTRPTVSVVDVTPRRLQAFKPTTGKVRWTYGTQTGVVAKDAKLGVYTIPQIPVSQTPTTLRLVAVPADTPVGREEADNVAIPPSAPAAVIYDGTLKTAELSGGLNCNVSGNTGWTDAGEYTITCSPKEGFVWVDGTSEPKSYKFVISKAANSWLREPSISATGWEAGKCSTVVDVGEASFGTVAASYSTEQLASLTAGDYEITFSVAETKNYTGLEKRIPFSVSVSQPPTGDGEDPEEPEEPEDPSPAMMVSLTFDDGYGSHYSVVAPALEKYGYRGTFNIIVNQTGRSRSGATMDWAKVAELAARGHEIALHSKSHPESLLEGWNPKPESVLRYEMDLGQQQISQKIGVPCRIFCFPGNHVGQNGELESRAMLAGMLPETPNRAWPGTGNFKAWFQNLSKSGTKSITLMFHGCNSDSGYQDLTKEQFEEFAKSLKECEDEGLIQVVSYWESEALKGDLSAVAVPFVPHVFYDGTVRFPVVRLDGCVMEPFAGATDAGEYELSFSLADPEHRHWVGGGNGVKKATFIIEKSDVWLDAPKLSRSRFAANGELPTLNAFVPSEGVTATLDGQPFDWRSGELANTVGEHTLVFTAPESKNFTALTHELTYVVTATDESLDWVETDGASYFDPQVWPGSNTTVTVEYATDTLPTEKYPATVFGSHGWDETYFRFVQKADGATEADWGGTSERVLQIPLDRQWHTLTMGARGLSRDGETFAPFTSDWFGDSTNLLFGADNLGWDNDIADKSVRSLSFGRIRYRSIEVRERGVLVRSLRPIRIGGEAGLWDDVEARFYGNAFSSGTILGSDEYQIVYAPYDGEVSVVSGNKSTVEGQTLLTFVDPSATGHFTLTKPAIAWILAVGGGGGGAVEGGHGRAGGGDGGAFVERKAVSLEAGTYDVVVGAGGAAAQVIWATNVPSNNGEPSSVSMAGETSAPIITAPGGVGGRQGSSILNSGNGGNGAGQAGLAGSENVGGNGGYGEESAITGTVVTYAAGGGGSGMTTAGRGGVGGGGNAATPNGGDGAAGEDGKGSGGGAASKSNQYSGKGGNGVVYVRILGLDADTPQPPDPSTPEITQIALPAAVSGLVYTGQEQVGVLPGNGYEVTGNTAVDAGTYEATVVLSNPEGTQWADAGANERKISWFIAQALNEWTQSAAITETQWTLGSSAGVVTSPLARFGEVKATLNGEPWDGEMPVAKGSYTLQWTVAASKNWTELSTSLSFAIEDKPAVVEGDAEVSASENTFAKYWDGGDLVLVFSNTTAVSSFTLASSASARILVVGGGGAGGSQGGNGRAAGGGAGGFLEMDDVDFTPGTYVVTVGAGGASVNNAGSVVGGSGGDSSITKGGDCIALAYGGGGGGAEGKPGAAGGSGGGGGGCGAWASYSSPGAATQAGSPFEGYGNAGGATSIANAGSGGGGAGAPGASLSYGTTQGGDGGEGRLSDITGESVCYAGGGGGAGSTAGGVGGLGGGGSGSAGAYANGKAGADGLGGGGGGCGGGNHGYLSGKGGSGVVIVRLTFVGGGEPETLPKPQVDGVDVEPGKLAEEAKSGMEIVIPQGSKVSIDPETGSVTLDGSVVCTFPGYYTVKVSDSSTGGAQVVALELNESARPSILDVMLDNGEFCITVPDTISGLFYSLEYKRLLDAPSWDKIDVPIQSTGEAKMVLRTKAQDDSGFYRVSVSDR